MYERLLVAVDHSEVSERVLAAARDLAALSKGQIWVLHLREREVIAQMGLVPTESDAAARAAVDSAVEAMTQAGIDAPAEGRDTRFGHSPRESLADASPPTPRSR